MERFVDEQENAAVPRDRSASPINSLLFGDPKRHHHDVRSPGEHGPPSTPDMDIVTAMELVHKVVETNKLQLSPLKAHQPPPELITAVTSLSTCPVYVPPASQPNCFVFGGAMPVSTTSSSSEVLNVEPVATLVSLSSAVSSTPVANIRTADLEACVDSSSFAEPTCKRLKVDVSEEKENCVQLITSKSDCSSANNFLTSSNDITDRGLCETSSSSIAVTPSTKKTNITLEKSSSPLLCEGGHNKMTGSNMALAISSISPTIHNIGDSGVSLLSVAESSRSPPLAAGQSLAQ